MADITTWKIDPAHTSVEFSVKHMMFTTVRGRFRDVQGEVVADPENPENSSVEVEIEASTIDTGVDDRDAHLRSADFLDADNHPTITFRSKRVEGAHAEEGDRFRVIGDLTIRGETREIALDAEFQGVGTDPWGAQRAGFEAKGELDRHDFGLRWNQALETGGVLVGNKLKLQLTVQAVEQQEAHAGVDAD